MNKAELINSVAGIVAGSTKKQIGEILDGITTAITATVAAGDKVTLVGFGSFEQRDRAARKGVNPKTKEPLDIPATTVPAFNPGKEFRELVAEKRA